MIEYHSDLYSRQSNVSDIALAISLQLIIQRELEEVSTISDLNKSISYLDPGKAQRSDDILLELITRCQKNLPKTNLLYSFRLLGGIRKVPHDMRDTKTHTLNKNKGEKSDYLALRKKFFLLICLF